MAMIFHTTARGSGTALLMPANPSLPLNPQPWLWMQYMEPSTQGGSQTLLGLKTTAALQLSTLLFLKKGVKEAVSCFAVTTSQEQLRQCYKMWHLSPALPQELSRWG